MRSLRLCPEVVSIETATVPVGIKLDSGSLNESPGRDYMFYSGPSYCDAVRRASRGEKLFITAGSIKKCRWAPVTLGFKEPENSFERSLAPRFENINSIYAFPIGQEDEETIRPDLVIIRDRPGMIKKMFEELLDGRLEGPYVRRFDMSALAVINREKAGLRAGGVNSFNRLVCRLKGYRRLREAAEFALKSPLACYLFDKIITLFLADMSVCRNSTVIPALEGRANCSYFCSGAVFWGGNDPACLTAGIPYDLFCRLEKKFFITGPLEKDTEIMEQEGPNIERRGQNRRF